MSKPVILITGAGKGIGRGIVEELCAQARANVFSPRLFLTARDESELGQRQSDCESAGLECRILPLDLTGTGAPGELISRAEEAWGGVDCLVNNAGVGRFGELTELTPEDFDYVMATNARATFLLTQAAYRGMRKRGRGHLVFITSISAEKPFEQSAVYCMSKFAQKGLIEVLRLSAYGAGIRITNVMPGAVETPMWGPLSPEQKARMMSPRDVGRVVVEAIRLGQKGQASVEEIVIRPVSGDL